MNKNKFKAILKGITGFAAITAVAVGLSACGNGGSKKESATSGTITFLNNHTDWQQDGTWKKLIAQFNKKYPNIKVNCQALGDYAGSMKTRMNSKNYGDVFLLPTTVQPKDRSHYVISLGSTKQLSKKYYGLSQSSYAGKQYGIPTVMDGQGVVVNWKVFQKAGIKTFPKTPKTFIAALKKIKSKEKGVTPLYTNYTATWALGNWDFVRVGASGDKNFNNKLIKNTSPFSKGQTLNTIYRVLYDATKDKLVEKDPMTSDWEQSKQDMADGKIGVMVLGNWAVNQIQAKNKKNAKDIKFFAFPMTAPNGKQYCPMSPDYALSISKYSKNKKAARTFINWLVDDSDYTKIGGGIPTRKGRKFPASLDSLNKSGAKLIEEAPVTKGKEGMLEKINDDSEIGLGTTGKIQQTIIESALGQNKQSFEQIMAGLNSKWAAAVKKDNK